MKHPLYEKIGSLTEAGFRDYRYLKIVPLKGARINCYRLFTGTSDDGFGGMIDIIKTEVAY